MLIHKEAFIERARQHVLETLDAFAEYEFKDRVADYEPISKRGAGAIDGDLPELFKWVDAHAEHLAARYGAVLVDYDPDEVARRDLRAMGNRMTYKGFEAVIEFSAEDDALVGHLEGTTDVVGFHGSSVAEVRLAFCASVDAYIADCAEIGKEPQKP